MADGWLLKGIQDLVDKIKLLEIERSEAVAKAQRLEHEKAQTAATIEALERAESEAAANIEAFERGERQAAVKIEELEREKKQAALTIQGLEREVGELGALIALATEKVTEALKEGATADISQPMAANAPATSMAPGQVAEYSADLQKELKGHFPRVFDPTEYSTQ